MYYWDPCKEKDNETTQDRCLTIEYRARLLKKMNSDVTLIQLNFVLKYLCRLKWVVQKILKFKTDLKSDT